MLNLHESTDDIHTHWQLIPKHRWNDWWIDGECKPLRPVSLHSRFLCLHLAPYPSYIHDSSIVTGEGLVNQVTEILEDLKQRGIRIWMLDPKGMPLPEGMHSIEETMNNNLPPDKEELESNPPRSVRQGMTMKDPFAYIYTSGTTGKIRIHVW